MQSTPSGLTFSDHDVKMCRTVIGLISRATYKETTALFIKEAAVAISWIEAMVPQIQAHIFDMSKAVLTEAPQETKAES